MRRRAALLLPPIQIGGCGDCVGGCNQVELTAAKSAPVTGVSGEVQIDRNAVRASSSSSARRSKSVPT
jgi:hypothetical protein